MDNKTIDNIKLARGCMNFSGIKCENKICTNEYCPLNEVYDSQIKPKNKENKCKKQ